MDRSFSSPLIFGKHTHGGKHFVSKQVCRVISNGNWTRSFGVLAVFRWTGFRRPSCFLGVIWLTWIASLPHVTAAEPEYPLSIAVSASGDIYLADRNLPGIWMLKGGSPSVLFKGAKQFKTPLNAVRCVAMDQQDKLLAGDTATRDIYRMDDKGQPVSLTRITAAKAAKSGTAPATDKPSTSPLGQIGMPMDIAVAANGDLFVSDLELHRIVKVPKDGGEPKEFAAIAAPRGLFCDKSDNLWVISGRKLVKISPAGEKVTVVGDGKFEFPHTVAIAADGTAYVCDGYAQTIWKVVAGSEPKKLASGPPLLGPVGMRLAGDKLFVADPKAKAVFQVTLDGKTSVLWQVAAAK